MDKLYEVVAAAIQRAARSRPMLTLWAVLAPTRGAGDEQRGQGLAEYALILGLIAIVAIVSLIFLGTSVSGLFEDIVNEGFRKVQGLIGNG